MYLNKFFIFLIFGFCIDTICSREMRTLILYNRPVSWQDANSVCVDLGYDLLVIDSKDVLITMQKLRTSTWSAVSGLIWVGLHAPKDDNNQRTPFKWMKGCLPLDGNVHVWKTSHPQAWGSCTLVDPTNQFESEVMGCSSSFGFICQRTQGPCIFEASPTDSTITGASSTITHDPSTEDACKNHCLQTNFIEECWAITMAGDKCTLHLATSAFYFEDKTTAQAGTTLFMKRCYDGTYFDYNASPSPTTATYNSEPVSSCNSTSTEITAIEKYNLVPNDRMLTSIQLHEDTFTRTKAQEKCKGNGGNLVYIDLPLQQLIDIQLPIWAPSTPMWIGVKGTGWDSGQPITFANDNVFPATTLDKSSGKWLSANTANELLFICQRLIGDCNFNTIKDKAIGSSMSDSGVTLEICQNRCRNYAYEGNDCWAVSYSSDDSTCLYHFSKNPLVALDANVVVDGTPYGLSLYRKVCYTFTVVPATTATSTPISTSSSSTASLSSQVETSLSSSLLIPSSSSYSSQSQTPWSSSSAETLSPSSSSSSSSSYSDSLSPSPTQIQSSSSYLESSSPTSTVIEVTASDQSTLSAVSPSPSSSSSSSYFLTQAITSNINNITQYDNQTCLCVCNRATLKLDSPELKEKLKVISAELFVDPKEVSASKRKYISVEDPRPSARAVGSVLGITTLCLVFGFLILLDVQKVVSWFVEYITSQYEKRK